MSSFIAPADYADHENNILAAGAVLMALWLGQPKSLTSLEAVPDEDGESTNQIDVTFSFLQSTYRITVERVPD